jgi:(2Fe-2S) ferredoxin
MQVHSQSDLRYEKHILVCVNDRSDGRWSCGHHEGLAIYEALKAHVKSHGLVQKVWVSRTGCLGLCPKEGVLLKVDPGDTWYEGLTLAELPSWIETQLAGYPSND